jgi:hypothetical protein
MTEKSDRKITYPQNGGFFQDLTMRIKLILRLMGDSRVSPWLKLLPIGSLVYLVVPDIVPGPIDDAAVIWLATYVFVELCPPAVVQEHMEALKGTSNVTNHYQGNAHPGDQGEVIDGEVIDVDDPEGK